MNKNIEFINTFWIYGNKFAVMDSFNTIWKIGDKEEMIDSCDKMNNDSSLSYYAPFAVVQITKETSSAFTSNM